MFRAALFARQPAPLFYGLHVPLEDIGTKGPATLAKELGRTLQNAENALLLFAGDKHNTIALWAATAHAIAQQTSGDQRLLAALYEATGDKIFDTLTRPSGSETTAPNVLRCVGSPRELLQYFKPGTGHAAFELHVDSLRGRSSLYFVFLDILQCDTVIEDFAAIVERWNQEKPAAMQTAFLRRVLEKPFQTTCSLIDCYVESGSEEEQESRNFVLKFRLNHFPAPLAVPTKKIHSAREINEEALQSLHDPATIQKVKLQRELTALQQEMPALEEALLSARYVQLKDLGVDEAFVKDLKTQGLSHEAALVMTLSRVPEIAKPQQLEFDSFVHRYPNRVLGAAQRFRDATDVTKAAVQKAVIQINQTLAGSFPAAWSFRTGEPLMEGVATFTLQETHDKINDAAKFLHEWAFDSYFIAIGLGDFRMERPLKINDTLDLKTREAFFAAGIDPRNALTLQDRQGTKVTIGLQGAGKKKVDALWRQWMDIALDFDQ